MGKYGIVGRLGRGGQGTALKAFDPDLGRHVVLKQYHGANLGDQVAQALDEGRALARVHHPNIAQCLAADRLGDSIVLVIEYVPGRNLGELRRDRPPSFAESARIIELVAAGLAEVHACNLLHRDLKPANIVLGDDGQPRLVDFGLALGVGSRRLDSFSGTVAYMAPEQARSEPERIGPRTDVFGLGAVLYFLLTGRPPYQADSFPETLKLARRGEFPAPRQVNPKIPRALERICLKAMAPLPEQRFTSASQLQQALRRYRRRPPFMTLVAGVAAVIVLGLAAFFFHARHSRPAPSPLEGSLAVNQFRYSDQRGQFLALGELGTDVHEAHFKDDLRVHLRLSEPAYCYLLALNPNGGIQPCLPDDPGKRPERTQDVIFPPTEEEYFWLDDGAGIQAFVLIASREPLPPYSQWAPAADGLAWTATRGEGVWEYDGRALHLRSARGGVAPQRGSIHRRSVAPRPLLSVCNQLREAPGVELVRAVAFPVVAERP